VHSLSPLYVLINKKEEKMPKLGICHLYNNVMPFVSRLASYGVALLLTMSLYGGCSTSKLQDSVSKQSTPEIEYSTFIPLEEESFPFVGALYSPEGLIGSAVLIAPRVALTAGHCLTGDPLIKTSFGGVDYEIEKVVPYHEDHEKGDIGLIFYKEAVTNATPVKLLKSIGSLEKYSRVTSIGYGGGKKRMSAPGTFRYYGVLYDELDEIKMIPFHDTIWYGDSGGALLHFSIEGIVCVGILTNFTTLNGLICENGVVRVDYYRDWIQKTIKKRG